MMRLMALLAAVLTACGGSASTPSPEPTAAIHTIAGTFTLTDVGGIAIERAGHGAPAESCEGTGGYDDIEPGTTQVVIRDGDGSTLGTGRLAFDEQHEPTASRCILVFSVDGIPDAEFYAVEVGDRGELTFSRDEMESGGWSVVLTLGG